MGSFRETKNPEQPPGIMPRRAVRLCAQIISRTPMVWHFIEYPRQDVSGENMYVCLGAMIWIWTPIVHGFALPIGMVLKSAMELIYHLSFLGVKTEKCEFYTAQRQLRILVPKGTLRLTQKMKCQLSRLTWSNSVSPTLSFCDAETQTEIIGEFLDGLEFEFKSTVEEKDELTTDSACIKKSEVWHFKI